MCERNLMLGAPQPRFIRLFLCLSVCLSVCFHLSLHLSLCVCLSVFLSLTQVQSGGQIAEVQIFNLRVANLCEGEMCMFVWVNLCV